MIVWFFFFGLTREFFMTHFGDVTIAGEELQILTYARHLWALSSEGSLACHTCSVCNSHLRGPVTLTPNAELWEWSCHYLF